MKLELINKHFAPAGELEVPDAFFARAWNEHLAHRLTVSEAANARQATRKQLNRAGVKHSTRKLRRQKGSGAARVGMAGTPIRRGGGRAFPNTPNENFSRRLNRKEYRAALASLVSRLVRESRVVAASELVADERKTAPMAKQIDTFAPDLRVLFVDTDFDTNFVFSLRNLPSVAFARLSSLRAADLLKCDRTVISRRAVERISEVWA
ncbi:MAG: 50S ribosomal protein L4 [Betaproteobacteria bacterium]|nr:50S ribosomal protein L4 [Betaproteobacteria bacterium]